MSKEKKTFEGKGICLRVVCLPKGGEEFKTKYCDRMTLHPEGYTITTRDGNKEYYTWNSVSAVTVVAVDKDKELLCIN